MRWALAPSTLWLAQMCELQRGTIAFFVFALFDPSTWHLLGVSHLLVFFFLNISACLCFILKMTVHLVVRLRSVGLHSLPQRFCQSAEKE
jgi:hypothetical protein